MALDRPFLIKERGRIWGKFLNLDKIRDEHVEIWNKSRELWRLREMLTIEEKQINLMYAVIDIDIKLGLPTSMTEDSIKNYKETRDVTFKLLRFYEKS